MSKPAFFKHDIGASNDPAIIKMRVAYGCLGYGLYWLIVEYLWGTHDGSAALADIPTIAYAIREDDVKLQQFITVCIDEYGLFKSDGVSFWSERLKRDLANWNDTGEKRQLAGKIGAWKKHHPEQPLPKEILEACSYDEIGKESQGVNTDSSKRLASAKQLPKMCYSKILQNQNQNKKNIYVQPKFKKPTLEEVEAYCIERKNEVDPQRFIDHYSSNGWKVGKNPMKDWKAAIRNWERNNGIASKSPSVANNDSVQIGAFLNVPEGGPQ
jgi:hypothetical protein